MLSMRVVGMLKGMDYILSCFADIRDWVPGKDILCK